MLKNSTTILNAIGYSISTVHKTYLDFERQIAYVAEVGNNFANTNIDPYIEHSIQPLQYYKKVITSPEAQNIIDYSADFALCRLPNHKEAITNILIQTTVNFFAGRVKLAFGSNPTAGAIIRDMSKLPSIEANVAGNNNIGFTDIKYGLGSLYASRTKVACKATILTAYSGYKFIYPSGSTGAEKEDFQLVARGANYVCEIPSRYLHITEKRKQAFERENPEAPEKEFFDFLKEDGEISWAFEAVGEALIKTTVSDQLGELARKSKYEDYIKDASCFIDNVIAIMFFGPNQITFESQDDVYTKAFKYAGASWSASGGSLSGIATAAAIGATAFIGTAAVDFVGQAIIETINTYGLGTPTRICQDASGTAIKNSYHVAEEIYNSYYNQTPLSGENSDDSLGQEVEL